MAWEDTAYDWALEFDAQVKGLILSGDHKKIIHYSKLGRSARLAVPTPEHFLPLLYVLGAQVESDGLAFFADRVTLGSMSMRSVRIG
jgi:4,5-DOPA dioxygenase extradiol